MMRPNLPMKKDSSGPRIVWALNNFQSAKWLFASAAKFLFLLMKIVLLIVSSSVLFSCRHGWKESEKAEVFGGCVSKAALTLGEARAKAYCNCMVRKLVEKYPNASDAKYVQADTSVYRMAQECFKEP